MAYQSGGTDNILLVTDSYKYILKRWMVGPVITREKIQEAKELYKAHLGSDYFNEEGWNYILEHHDGQLPLRIKAVPEGFLIPCHNVLFTVENTDPKCYWLTNFFESLLVQVWYPMTVATSSRYHKEIIVKYLEETADDLTGLPYKLNEFGFRGSTSMESAGIGGASHLVNFMGTDTIAALATVRQYYGCKMAGHSIPSAEHSTITTWGREGEVNAFKNMLSLFPRSPMSCVSDSYNIWNACEKIWGEKLKNLVIDRGQKNGMLIVRPDSGDPPEVVVQVLNILGEQFGTETNSKNYKMLPPYLRVMQADGFSHKSLVAILDNMKKNNWSADNVMFGSGNNLLQSNMDRDTQKCAYKCSYAVINGKEVNVFKSPITDPGKNSKRGRLTLELEGGENYKTIEDGQGNPEKDLLIAVFENGKLLRDYTFTEVRKNAELDTLKN